MAATFLAGCAALPSSGPTGADITSGSGRDSQFHYRIIEITPTVLSAITQMQPAPLSSLGTAVGTGGAHLADGDVLAVTVYTVGANPFGGASSSSGQAPDAAHEALPSMMVTDGAITMPFAGRIAVAGLTVPEIQDRIAAALRGRSIQPQVLVNIVSRINNAVLVYGDVKASGRYPMPLARLNLVDAVALAGGGLHPARDTIVQVTRGGRYASASLADVYAMEGNNIELSPGDRIELLYKPRTYTVFGASAKVLQFNFEQPQLNLAEAIARSGGPDQQFADPDGIYLFRFETPAVASRLRLTSPANAVIYHLSLMNSDSYFALQKFAMRDQDIIYVANARSNLLLKFFALLGQAVSPASTANNITR